MRRQGTQKKSELQMGTEQRTFRTLVGHSTTEQWVRLPSGVFV